MQLRREGQAVNFDQALGWVKQLKAAGEIRQYMIERDLAKGRVITVETDQGWNPDPFFTEFEAL